MVCTALQFLGRVEQLRGHQAAAPRRRRGLLARPPVGPMICSLAYPLACPMVGSLACPLVGRMVGSLGGPLAGRLLRQDLAGALHVLDALAGDVAELQCHDGRGDLAADLLRACPHHGSGIAGSRDAGLDRCDAGGKAAGDRPHCAGMLADERLGRLACRLQMLPRADQFPIQQIVAAARGSGGTADFGGERQESGAGVPHRGRQQPCIHRQDIDFLQHGMHAGDASIDRRDDVGELPERGHIRAGDIGELTNAGCDGGEIAFGLGQLGTAQVAEQRLECRRQRPENADSLLQAVADRGEMALGQAAQ